VRNTLLASAFGVGLLFVFYRAVRSEWPDNYMSVDSSGLEYAIISHPLKYFAFRFLPIYLVCVFVAVSLDRSGTEAAWAVLFICVLHAALNSGTAIWRMTRSNEGNRQAPLLLMHIVVAIGVFAAGGFALLTRSDLARFVPTLHELGAALWTAAFAAVFGVYILNASRADRGSWKAIQRSREQIPQALYDLVDSEAKKHGADSALVKAVMVVENTQRPRWFRKCENFKGHVFKHGSYGIMQVAADGPISDEESIRRAVTTRFAGIQVPLTVSGTNVYVDFPALTTIARKYNPSDGYASAVVQAFGTFWKNPSA
jgi:hypothetical protein